MIVNGREIKFLRTVEANFKIEEMCPDHDFNRFGELLEGSVTQMTKTEMALIIILNEAHESREKYLNPNHVPQLITEQDLMMMTAEEFEAAANEAMAALAGKQTVEIEPAKKKENQTA